MYVASKRKYTKKFCELLQVTEENCCHEENIWLPSKLLYLLCLKTYENIHVNFYLLYICNNIFTEKCTLTYYLWFCTRLKNKVKNKPTWEVAFYQSDWVKINSSWVILFFCTLCVLLLMHPNQFIWPNCQYWTFFIPF